MGCSNRFVRKDFFYEIPLLVEEMDGQEPENANEIFLGNFPNKPKISAGVMWVLAR